MLDLAQDLGFANGVGVGNLVFMDSNANGRFDAAVDEGLGGIIVERFMRSGSSTPLAVTVSSSDGSYKFTVPPGDYHVQVPAHVAPDAPLALMDSSLGAGHRGHQGLALDDDADEDGVDDGQPRS